MAISKKAMAAAGTGAAGAAGATALALGLGAFGGDGEITAGKSFAHSSAGDELAIISDDLEWEAKFIKGNLKISIDAKKKNGNILWQCKLRPIVFEDVRGEESFSTLAQGKELLRQIEDDKEKKRKFVNNCSGFRQEREMRKGLESDMDLDTVKDKDGKFKFKDFEKLWTEEGFEGGGRLNQNEENLIDKKEWKIDKTKTQNNGKTTVTVKFSEESENWSCSISSKKEGELEVDKFKEEQLKNILKKDLESSDMEKKVYLVKNCARNNKKIKDLEIQTDNNGKWEFKNFEGTLLKKLYTNPK